MRILSFVTEENKRLYDINTIRRILDVSRSKVQREIRRNHLIQETKYKNLNLYSEKTLFSLMEKILMEKIDKEYNGRL